MSSSVCHETPNTEDDWVIRVEGLGKCYQIYDRPSDRLKQMLVRNRRHYFREFWALRDVSFQIKKGETLGIIGRNGSGKSTLLQMICGTLTPTLGRVEVRGKVAALLELGAGFNPEFTGRENVYMAASIYGLSEKETDERFEKISMFADIGDHLDQPVKTYSSGMFVRLAFAVIAHVDADVLVIDEALAVGDAVFTQKCMRFIRKFKENGTLIFVSHDMSSVLNLCKTALWLHQSEYRGYGAAKEISDNYLRHVYQEVYGDEVELSVIKSESGSAVNRSAISYDSEANIECNLSEANGWRTGAGEVISVALYDRDNRKLDVIQGGEIVRLKVRARLAHDFVNPILGFIVRDRLGQDLFGENTLPIYPENHFVPNGTVIESIFEFNMPMLANGDYAVMCSLADGVLHDHIQHHYLHDALVIRVSSAKVRWGLVGLKFNAVSLNILNE